MNKNRFFTALFVILVLFQGVTLTRWVKKDNSIPGVDDSIHLSHSLMCHYLLQNSATHNMYRILTISPYYPPFFPCSSTVPYRVLDTSYASARSTNIIFLMLLLIVVFLMGRKLFSCQTAFFASLLLSFYPMTLSLSRFYYLDLSLCFFVSLALYFLVLSKNFSNLPYSILFGLACGFGMLTKWTFSFFLAVPALYCFYTGWRNKPQDKRRIFLHALSSALICLALCGPWYAVNAEALKRTFTQGFYLDAKQDPSSREILFYTFYLKALITEQLQMHHFVVFFVAIFILIRRKKFSASEKFLFVQLISSLMIYTAIHNKDVRFTAPVLPSVALLTAHGVSQFSLRKNESIAGVILCLVSFSSYAQFCPRPRVENWKLEETAEFLSQSVSHPEKPVFVGIYSPHDKIHFYTLQYFFLRSYFEKYGAFPFVLREHNKPDSSGEDIFILKAASPAALSGMKVRKSFFLPDREYLFIYFASPNGAP